MKGPMACVLLALVLISPWPIFALNHKRGVDPNLVAVPAMGDSIHSAVSPVFSRGRFFQIVDLERGRVTALPNPFREAKHAAGLRSAYLLLREEVGVVIARHIGPEPFNNLTIRGVRVFTGRPASVKEAIELYRRGELARADHPDVQIHYGLERQGVAVPPAPAGPCPLATPANVSAASPTRSPQQLVGIQRSPLAPRAFFPALGIEVAGLDGGVVVLGVAPESGAAASGLTRGDVILRIDDRRVLDLPRFAALVDARPPETIAKLRIVRHGRIETRHVVTREARP